MKDKTFHHVAGAIFLVLAVAHAARLFYGWEATIADEVIPLWMSAVAAAVAIYLALRAFQVSTRR